jgi:hypothetical protein
LGSKGLSLSNLHSYSSELQSWGNTLSDDADILLYGCDVAQGTIGQSFVQQLAQLTGADIAASDNRTGNAALGGNWTLEVNIGHVDAPLAFLPITMQSYGGVLDDAVFASAQQFGGGALDSNSKTFVDGAGNVYTVGSFFGTVDFDPGVEAFALTSAGFDDIFVSKLDGNGNFVWAKRIGSSSHYDQATGISVDGSGNVYTTGYFQGTADFDPGIGTLNLTSAGSTDIFVSKLDASGNFVWAKGMGSGSDDFGTGISVDSNGNVYTTGHYDGTVDFDPGAGTTNLTNTGGFDNFVSKLDASGNFVWAKGMGSGSSSVIARGISVDGSGNVYTTGSFLGTADFDPGADTTNLTSTDTGRDIFVSKLDVSGNFVWAKGMGGNGTDQANGISVDRLGNVYTTGYYSGTVDFDPGAGTTNLTNTGGSDIFVSKLDASGNFVWAKGMGGNGTDQANGISVDGLGNVYTTGVFQNTADFDPGAGTVNLTSVGDATNGFISKLSQVAPNLVPTLTVSATTLGYTENDRAILIDPTATVADADSTDFDTGTLTVNFSANGTVDDHLAIRNQGVSAGQIGVSGSTVSYEDITIGTFTGGTGSTALVITFNTSATATAVSALLQNLTYANVSEAPSTAARTVQFVMTDSDGGTSTAVTKTINVMAVDDTEFFVTNTNDSGSGSLRQAVLDANADAGAETITFVGSTFTDATPDSITLTTGELGISSDVTLTGTGANLLTISGNNASRVLNISSGVVSIDGVTIANGQTSETLTNGQFNALNVGGGVSNSGTLTLNNSLFTNSRAVFGGGLHNKGTLTINQSLFTQNHAYGGGGLSSDGTLTVNNSTFFNNTTDDGAGIGTGGGIQLGRGTAVLTNVTLSGNQANGGRDDGGGGIMVYGGQLTVINSTIFGNSTTSTTGGGGISNIGAGSIQITLKNTIVAGNTSVASKPDVSGTVVSGGNNLIGANNGSTGFTNGTNGDLVGTIVTPINPLLAALAANGGLTQTHALLPGSTAINSGTSTGAPVTDQRGISRVGAVDIGAFESRGFTVALTGGNNQSTSISTTFTNPLTVNVSSAFNEPVAGGQITYKPNGLGSADASFASSSATVDSSGNASATTTANGTAGSYNVTAGGAGIATAASFSLTNTPPDALPTTLLWRNGTMGTAPTGTGENVVWQLNNFTLQSGYFIPTVADLNWQIISTADFDRDGHADILWRNRATGENVIWQMNSTGLQSGYFLTPVADANWRIIDTATSMGTGRLTSSGVSGHRRERHLANEQHGLPNQLLPQPGCGCQLADCEYR